MKLSRFNLRDLFWLVLVVGLAVGWWAREREYHYILALQHEELDRVSAEKVKLLDALRDLKHLEMAND